MNEIMLGAIGFVGAFVILLAYIQVSRHAWKPRSRVFQLSNAVGAAFLLIYGVQIAAWPNVLLNIVWLGVAVVALRRIRRT